MRRKKLGFLTVFGTIIFLTILLTNPLKASSKSITLTTCSYVPESHAASKAFAWWLDYLEKESKGQLKFKRFYGGALLPGPDTVAGIGKGIADIGMISPGYVPGKFPLSMVGFLPYLTANPYAFSMARIELYKTFPEIREEFKKANVHWISPVSTAPGHLCSRKPVRTVEDLKGLRVRGYGYATKAIGLLGASPAAIAYGETFTALQTGVVDGAIGNSSDIYSQKWYEAAKYLVDIDFGMYIVCIWCFNQDSWNKLPSDLKKMIEESAHLLFEKELELFDTLGIKWLKESEAIGCDIYMWPEAEKAKAKRMVREPIIESWINEIPEYKALRRRVVDEYLKLIAKYEKQGKTLNPFVKFRK